MKPFITFTVLLPLFSLAQFSFKSPKLGGNDSFQSDTNNFNSFTNTHLNSSLNSQKDTSLYFENKRFEIDIIKEFKKEMIKTITAQADSFMTLGDYPNSFECFKQSLKINKEIDNKQGVAQALNSMALIYWKQGEYLKSIEYYKLSLSITEKINDKQGTAENLLNIALIYSYIENFNKAIDYAKRCQLIYESIGNNKNIADCYNKMGKIFFQKGSYDIALEYYSQALAIQEDLGNNLEIGISLRNIGLVYKLRGNYSEAINYFKQSLAINKKIGNKEGIAISYNKMGEIFQSIGKCDSAITHSSTALKIAQEINQLNVIANASKVLHSAYKSKKQLKKALTMYELFYETNDSIKKKKDKEENIHQDYKYKYAQKRISDSLKYAQLFELNKRNRIKSEVRKKNIRNIISLSLLFSLIIIVLFIRTRTIKIRTEKEFLQREIQVLKSAAIIQMALSNNSNCKEQLNREKIDVATKGLLNDSDWKILTLLCKNPTINNREISGKISLSFEGVRSSLKKMYRIFKIHHTIENQRIALIIEATRISNSI